MAATLRSERRGVLPEDVLHRAADLAERRAVAQRLLDGRQDVVGAAGRGAQLLEALLDERLVAVLLERLEARDLRVLALGVDAQEVRDLDLVLFVLVDADDDVLAEAVALLVAPGRLVDLAGDELDRVDRAAELVDLGDQLQRTGLDLRGQRLDEVGPRER